MLYNRETILLLGDFRFTLTYIRSLARAGHRVILGQHDSTSHGMYSRDTAEIWQHPPLENDGNAFMEALHGFLSKRRDISLIFPLGDGEIGVIARWNKPLPGGVKAVMPDPAVVATCLDKVTMCRIVSDLDIPQAPFRAVSDRDELLEGARLVGYPCIIKPADQLERINGVKAIICDSPETLREGFPKWPPGTGSLLIQRFASGARHNIHFIARDGEMLDSVDTRTLRTDRQDGTGYTVDAESVERSPSLHAFSRQLVKHLDYTGLGCIQFLVDDENESVSFLEVNPRLGAAFAISDYLGIDFPERAIRVIRGDDAGGVKGLTEYPAGKRIAWTGGDILGLVQALREGSIGIAGALVWLRNIAGSFRCASIHATWSLRDPIPTMKVYSRMFDRFARVFFRRPLSLIRKTGERVKKGVSRQKVH